MLHLTYNNYHHLRFSLFLLFNEIAGSDRIIANCDFINKKTVKIASCDNYRFYNITAPLDFLEVYMEQQIMFVASMIYLNKYLMIYLSKYILGLSQE